MGYLCLTEARQREEVLQGKLYNSSEKLRNEVAIAATINSVSEGRLDHLIGIWGRNPMLLHWTWKVQYYFKQTNRKSAKSVIKDYQIHRKGKKAQEKETDIKENKKVL